jgi:PAS domain S-box-containing protein
MMAQKSSFSYDVMRSRHDDDGSDEEARESFAKAFNVDGPLREQAVYSLSFVGEDLEVDFATDNHFPLLDERMKRQLRNSYSTLQSPSEYNARLIKSRLPPHLHLSSLETLGGKVERTLPSILEEDSEEASSNYYAQPLPKTINDITASKLDKDERAIVITDTKNPYRITEVNTAWEMLCGYKRDECKGRSLGPLLQGPETDRAAVTALLTQLFSGEEAGTILTNYAKNGRKFRNVVRVGPVVDEMGKTVSFVGVLREIRSDTDVGGFKVNRDSIQLPFMS